MKKINQSSKWFVSLFALLTVACSSQPVKTEIQIFKSKATVSQPLLFIADPQIHNIYGRGLKQMVGVSDLVSKVAIRHPELNILAPLVLESLLERGISENRPNAIVVLGDATNIACSGEFEIYVESITAHKTVNMPLLMAHGNHDSYLMGTVNYYFPTDYQKNWKPKKMETAFKPTDESWWGKTTINSQHLRNWRDGCYQPTVEGGITSSPMNKSRWLAKYMALLESDGMISESAPMPTNISENTNYRLTLTAASNTTLGEINYRGVGIWFPPKFGDVPSKSFFTGTYDSFIVQSVDIDKTRLIIIDTSVCEKAQGGWKFMLNNAGENACIGREQLKIIKQYVQDTPTTSKLVIAGHFPLNDLSRSERKKLINIASLASNWVYMSAHSHNATTQIDWATGSEINVGSTTDWPMEANSVWFDTGQKNIPIYTYQVDKNPISYNAIAPNEASEVCRHLPAAKKLALIDTKNSLSTWKSPTNQNVCDVSSIETWRANGLKLKDAVSIIWMRFRDEPLYRESILKIAAAASKSENDSFELLDLIP